MTLNNAAYVSGCGQITPNQCLINFGAVLYLKQNLLKADLSGHVQLRNQKDGNRKEELRPLTKERACSAVYGFSLNSF